MRTNSEDLEELGQISARLLSLNSEKSRLDAEIACATERMRVLFEHRLLFRTLAATPRHGAGSSVIAPGMSENAAMSDGPPPSKEAPSTAGRADQTGQAGPGSARRRTNLADTTTATEIACILRIPERTAHRLVQHATVLVNHHPDTLTALRTGTISWSHTTALLHEYAGLPHATAAQLERTLLPIAEATTVTRLAHRARRLRTRLHPEHLDDRARTATHHRRVDLEPADDAMAWLHAYLPATDAAAIDAHLTRLARDQQTPTEPRTLPHLRADTLVYLLLTDRHPGDGCAGECSGPCGGGAHHSFDPAQGRPRVRAHINVTVPVLTLLGVDDTPADLEGYGPIPAATARRLAAHAPSFTRLLTHPETGSVLSVGRTTYTVPADLKRWLRVRDQGCRHPGCTVPASRCELDHTTPWSHEGPTSHSNLAHLCRKHHHLKTEGIWHYTQDPSGTLHARSPADNTYSDTLDPLLT